MIKNTSFKTLLLSSALCLLCLSACQTTQQEQDRDIRSSKINSALERAAKTAASNGESAQSLALLERVYKRNSSDPKAATNYARALRHADYLNRASIVMRPFAESAETTADVMNEYTAIQLALGNYTTAEEYAQRTILSDEDNYQAFHYLGIALDAQNMHKPAERAFRKGLEYWEGDPSPIMNNLALNLATQGHITEAKEILEKAVSIAPNRLELKRNLRIITTLDETQAPTRNPAIRDKNITVKPTKKPNV